MIRVDPAEIAELHAARCLALVLESGACAPGSALGLTWLFSRLEPAAAWHLRLALEMGPLPEEIAEPEGLEGAEVVV